jgi:large subunit ribosomal protein L9
MNVILLERVEKLGALGDVVNVKPGYARNFLIPQHKALRATKENVAAFEARKAQLAAETGKRREAAAAEALKMDGVSVVLIRQAGESGQLFGSVTAKDISEALTAAGFPTDRRQVLINTPVKALGIYDFRVALHPEVAVTVKVNVAKSVDEAAAQAAAAAPVAATA